MTGFNVFFSSSSSPGWLWESLYLSTWWSEACRCVCRFLSFIIKIKSYSCDTLCTLVPCSFLLRCSCLCATRRRTWLRRSHTVLREWCPIIPPSYQTTYKSILLFKFLTAQMWQQKSNNIPVLHSNHVYSFKIISEIQKSNMYDQKRCNDCNDISAE